MTKTEPHVHVCRFPGCDILSGCRCACGAFAMGKQWHEPTEVKRGDV